MDDNLAIGRSGGAASLAPARDLAKVGHCESPSPYAANPLECPTGSSHQSEAHTLAAALEKIVPPDGVFSFAPDRLRLAARYPHSEALRAIVARDVETLEGSSR